MLIATYLAKCFVRPFWGDPRRLAFRELRKASHFVAQLSVRHNFADHANIAARPGAARIVSLRGEVRYAVSSKAALVFAGFVPAFTAPQHPLAVRILFLCAQ